MGSKNKDEIYHILEKYEVYWEDATSLGEWKDMEDAKKDTPAIACTEGFLIKKNRNYHTFVMTISEKEVGDQMVIPTKNIKKMVKLGRKVFYKKDFEYSKYQT